MTGAALYLLDVTFRAIITAGATGLVVAPSQLSGEAQTMRAAVGSLVQSGVATGAVTTATSTEWHAAAWPSLEPWRLPTRRHRPAAMLLK